MRLRQLDSFASTGQHPVVADALDARWQDVQHDATHELGALQPHHSLAAVVIGAHREHHLMLADGSNLPQEVLLVSISLASRQINAIR